MREETFEVRVGGGSLVACAAAEGAPALLLHGGPAIPDYMGACAFELKGLFATIRYTQRGVPPSTVGAPYSVESHMDDALAVLDALGHERAWAIGHSWGGHLALHLLVAHPERLLGVVCVDALGAFDIVAEAHATMQRRLAPEEIERAAEILARRNAGETTEQELSSAGRSCGRSSSCARSWRRRLHGTSVRSAQLTRTRHRDDREDEPRVGDSPESRERRAVPPHPELTQTEGIVASAIRTTPISAVPKRGTTGYLVDQPVSRT